MSATDHKMDVDEDPELQQQEEEEEESMINPDEGDEIIPEDQDAPMDSDDEADGGPIEEIQLQNDSSAHFDGHSDSIFCIAQHPIHTEIVATGGGDNVAYIFDCTPSSIPTPAQTEREGIQPIFKIEGHPESVNAITFTKPAGEYLLTAGINGELRAYRDTSNGQGRTWAFVAEAREVEEINFLIPCPNPQHPNVVALGAKDGSVWVYTVDASDAGSPLTIIQTFYLHTDSATAGAWTPDGKLLCTVSEESSLYVWDVFGDAAAAGLSNQSGQALVGLTAEDQRFAAEGGLYSVAVAPNGTFVAVGGADGSIKIVGLPRIGADSAPANGAGQRGGRQAGARQAGGRQAGGRPAATSAGQAGQILASLQAQDESIETIAFAAAPATMMAAGSVDGYITLFDTAHNFTVRRKLEEAHEGEAVIKVEFVHAPRMGHLLTSCGNDGVIRRWDVRGGTAAANGGLLGEWRGHRGGGEGGGILGFVQGGGTRVITAGDE